MPLCVFLTEDITAGRIPARKAQRALCPDSAGVILDTIHTSTAENEKSRINKGDFEGGSISASFYKRTSLTAV